MPQSDNQLPVSESRLNGLARPILIGSATVLIPSIVIGLAMLWNRSVSAEGVSRQIETESPYLKDQGVIRKALTEEIPEIKHKVEQIQTQMMEQRIILERLDNRNP